jgi:UDP-N-acetylglucosamine--N-acetylmuramyl-(pentapeptide) pyrophosphoryl-undecaprenol N-acetylglucosamine transferase
MTVAEVSAVGLPAVFVPLPHGNGEQALNARPVVDAGGAVLVSDEELSPKTITDLVVPLVADAERLRVMGDAARGTGHREAADVLARMVLEVVG